MIRERRYGDDGVDARSPPLRERIWDRREVREDEDRRYVQAQRFPVSSERERFTAGSADWRRRDDGDGDRDRDGRLWNRPSSAAFSERDSASAKYRWNGGFENKVLDSAIPNSNLNARYPNSSLNPNSVCPNGSGSSIPDSGFKHGGGYDVDMPGMSTRVDQRYQGNHFPGMIGLPKPVLDNDRARNYPSYPTDHGVMKNHHGSGNWSLDHQNQQLPFGTRAVHREEKPMDHSGHSSPYGTPIPRFTNMASNNSRDEGYGRHSGHSSPYGTPIPKFANMPSNNSRDEGYGGGRGGSLSVGADGIRNGRSNGMLTESIGLDGIGYGQTPYNESFANSKLHLRRWDQQRDLLPSPMEMDAYPEMQRVERSHIDIDRVIGSDLYKDRQSVRDQELQRTGVLDSNFDRNMINGTQSPFRGGLHPYGTIPNQHDYTDQDTVPYPVEQDWDNLDPGMGSTRIEYETGPYMDTESPRANYYPKRDSDEDRLPMLDDDQDPYDTEGISNPMSMLEDFHSQDISKKMLPRKHAKGKKASRYDQSTKPYSNWGASSNKFHDQIHGHEQWDDGIDDQAYYDDDMQSSLNAPISMQAPSARFKKSAGRDVKNRLGPPARDIKKRLGPARRDIKKRLGPVGGETRKHLAPGGESNKHPSRSSCLLPWSKNYKEQKCLKRYIDDHHGSDTVPVADSSKVERECGKSDLPENSEEYKQLVHGTFLKFVKLLNENSAHRRRYMEQGGSGPLKCSVCSSKSKEFVDVKSLAKHALMSHAVGLRAEHMGFHKALCALMGWKRGAAFDAQWSPQLLSDTKAMAMKEDLIIWPPTVIIHNSSIASKNPAERVIISIGDLEAILRGIGFGGEKTKVCRGKPANQSIMVVSFPGTFSGLQEAEQLHKFYAEYKHGRIELQAKCNSSSNNSNANEETKTENSRAEKMKNLKEETKTESSQAEKMKNKIEQIKTETSQAEKMKDVNEEIKTESSQAEKMKNASEGIQTENSQAEKMEDVNEEIKTESSQAEKMKNASEEIKTENSQAEKMKDVNEEIKTENSQAEKMKDLLYGYLGIAGDLDKLDFETKKRCVVKSKKEIQVMAGAL